MSTATEKFEMWAIVELFGHNRIAGRVTEQVIAGAAFLRVDVPMVGEQPGFTKFYGASAIYSLTPVDADTALAAARSMRVRPIEYYLLPAGRADSPDVIPGDDDDDDDDDDLDTPDPTFDNSEYYARDSDDHLPYGVDEEGNDAADPAF